MEYLLKNHVIGIIEELANTIDEISVFDDEVTREQDYMAIAYLEVLSGVFQKMKPDKVD